jgi:hypothetical protein
MKRDGVLGLSLDDIRVMSARDGARDEKSKKKDSTSSIFFI